MTLIKFNIHKSSFIYNFNSEFNILVIHCMEKNPLLVNFETIS